MAQKLAENSNKARMQKLGLLSLSLMSFFVACQIATAQTVPSSAVSSPNIGGLRTPQFNTPNSQPVFLPNTNRGSGEFFDQGRENLFFLPEESSDEILKIDENPESDAEDTPSTEEETAQ